MVRSLVHKFVLGLSVAATFATPCLPATFGITGAIYGYRYIAPGAEFLDVRGLAGIEVFDPASQGSVLMTDSAGGDPIIPFGNSSLLVISGGGEVGAMLFDFPSASFTPTSMKLQALGLPIVPNPSIDPAMLALQGIFSFSFGLVDLAAVNETDFLATYLLTGITAGKAPAVPEPATGALFVASLAIVGVCRAVRARSAGNR